MIAALGNYLIVDTYGVTMLKSGSPLSRTLSQSTQTSRRYVARAQMTATSSAIIVSDQMG